MPPGMTVQTRTPLPRKVRALDPLVRFADHPRRISKGHPQEVGGTIGVNMNPNEGTQNERTLQGW
jgi:hypothetical protein